MKVLRSLAFFIAFVFPVLYWVFTPQISFGETLPFIALYVVAAVQLWLRRKKK